MSYKTDYKLKSIREDLNDLEKEIKSLETKAEESSKMLTGGKIMSVKPYVMGRVMSNVTSYESPKEARKKIEQLYQECLRIKNENDIAIKNNQEIKKNVMNFLNNIGLPKTYYGYKTNRARTKSELSYNWYGEINRLIPTSDGWAMVEDTYKYKLKEVNEWENKLLRESQEKENALKLKKEEQEKIKVLGVLSVKYGLDINSEPYEILDSILDKNKYLKLAHYLQENREDWTDGYSYAETGLRYFTIESELDQEIYDNINSYIEDWQCDGRVFRDCEYNYNVLYEMVKDKDLLDDYQNISQYTEEW